MTDTAAVTIMTTLGSPEAAAALARALIEARVAACVQELPVQSHYRWDGAVQCDREVLLLIKTAPDRVDAVMDAVRQNHPYDVPEILAVPVVAGYPAYLRWVRDETRPADAS